MSEQAGGRNTIRSLDGTREITVEEFDRIFDDGSDEIDEFIDWSKPSRVGRGGPRDPEAVYLSWPFTRGLVERVEAEAERQGVTRAELVARWLTERLDAEAPLPRDHAAE